MCKIYYRNTSRNVKGWSLIVTYQHISYILYNIYIYYNCIHYTYYKRVSRLKLFSQPYYCSFKMPAVHTAKSRELFWFTTVIKNHTCNRIYYCYNHWRYYRPYAYILCSTLCNLIFIISFSQKRYYNGFNLKI